jgi:hypothetical protein
MLDKLCPQFHYSLTGSCSLGSKRATFPLVIQLLPSSSSYISFKAENCEVLEEVATVGGLGSTSIQRKGHIRLCRQVSLIEGDEAAN